MNNKNKNKKVSENAEARKRIGKKIFLIFVCTFLSLALILGSVLGIVSAVRASAAAVRYNGAVMDEEVASYFASYYKGIYMSSVENSVDTPAFWNQEMPNSDKTYGEDLKENTKLYISQIVAANYLYENNALLSSSDKEKINTAVKEVLNYSTASGSVEKFNTDAAKYGFSYSSFKKAAEMVYKWRSVYSIMYGQNGSVLEDNLDDSDILQRCDEYLEEYTHVKLLIINTEKKYVLDEEGKKISDGKGGYEMEYLTEKEKADIEADMEIIRKYISGNASYEMSEVMFENYIKKYYGGELPMSDGYYFHPSASYTQNFPSDYRNIIEKSYSTEIGCYSEVETKDGVCFIYRKNPESGAYALSMSEKCFSDFYADLSLIMFNENVNLYSEEVVFTDKFDKIDLVTLPYNYQYTVSGF